MKIRIKCYKKIRSFCSAMQQEKNNAEFSDEKLLQQAVEDLKEAHELFYRVQEEDMVDFAVYNLKAAEKRHDFLLKRVKAKRQHSIP